ncbi:MAG: phage tail protein I [Deltaproteobacteria bacterium]|nr:phage tail protein I [Deltaproteobacteria bacterium]
MSSYLEHLPAAFAEDPFLARFLLAFERILTGLPQPDAASLPTIPAGLEQVIDRIETFFDPEDTPAEFLPWLAGWVATSLREDWDAATRRRFIANIVPLYRRRGTKHGLQKLLQLYLNPDALPETDLDLDVQITEPDDQPHYFNVNFTVRDKSDLNRKAAIAMDLIDREKPAHTFYGLNISYPSLQITDAPKKGENGEYISGVFVGVNTILGTGVLKTTP